MGKLVNYDETPDLSFRTALSRSDEVALAGFPRGDLHCHGILSCPIDELADIAKVDVYRTLSDISSISDIDRWVQQIIAPICSTGDGFSNLIGRALRAAARDGVTICEMSIGASTIKQPAFKGSATALVEALTRAHNDWAPHVRFLPEIGILRQHDPEESYSCLTKLLETGYFKSIDLYGNESDRVIGDFQYIYDATREHKFKRKAHVGETGDPEDVKKAAATLGLDAIQHGITAALSEGVMCYLVENDIQLNVCPASNACLGTAALFSEQPVRTLYDYGVDVTIGTDDLSIFGKTISRQFVDLYTQGVFSADELDAIRLNSLI